MAKNTIESLGLDLKTLLGEVDKLVESASKYTCNPDGNVRSSCQAVARKYKISYKELIKNYRPSGTLKQTLWDSEGNPISYEKLYGR